MAQLRTETRAANHISAISLLISCHSVVIKVFFLVLILSTAAVVAVILAIHFRVKKHLRPDAVPSPTASPEGSRGETGDQEKRSEKDGASDSGAAGSHTTKSS